MKSCKEILLITTQQLRESSDTPQLDAELLVMSVLKKSREYLFTHPEEVLTDETEQQIQALIQRRLTGEPIAYITGHKEFWTLDLQVTTATLIPRPETELLVEWLLQSLPQNEKLVIADLGIGSGAIALALASERPQWTLHATDTSAAALAVAKNNAQRLQINNIEFFLGSWLDALPQKKYAAIVSNPPYIKEGDPYLSNPTMQYEPHHALVAGEGGLEAIQQIIQQAYQHLLPGGWLILEHGYDQKTQVLNLLEEKGYENSQDHNDLAGQPRMCVGQLPANCPRNNS